MWGNERPWGYIKEFYVLVEPQASGMVMNYPSMLLWSFLSLPNGPSKSGYCLWYLTFCFWFWCIVDIICCPPGAFLPFPNKQKGRRPRYVLAKNDGGKNPHHLGTNNIRRHNLIILLNTETKTCAVTFKFSHTISPKLEMNLWTYPMDWLET
jgi:hypothetical protein